MVISPAMAYIGLIVGGIEGYRRVQYWFQFGGIKSKI